MERYYEAIDLLKGMISRPSFSRDETAVADFLQAEWQKAGQKVFRKGNNLWIIAPDFDFGKPTLLLNSHIDTVKPASGWTNDSKDCISLQLKCNILERVTMPGRA
jgi:acetylornithine deacetylase